MPRSEVKSCTQLLGCFYRECRENFPVHVVLENCQHTESGVLGHCLQQRDAHVRGWKCCLHRYLLNLTSPLQVLQRGTSVHLGSVSTSVLLSAGRIYVPDFWILIRTSYSPSCGFTALLLQMWVWAGVELKGNRLCIASPRCNPKVYSCFLVNIKGCSAGVSDLVQIPL